MVSLFKQSFQSYLLILTPALLLAFLFESYLIEKEFHRFAELSFAKLEQKTRSFDNALEEFASFIQVNPGATREQLRNHVQTLRQSYSGIYMFEVIKRISRDQRHTFEQSMRDKGYQDFSIHGFDYDSSRKVTSVDDHYAYFPIAFIEPENEHSAKVLGLDIGSTSPKLANAMMASIWSQQIVASKPFELLEGGKAYLLYHPIYRDSPWSLNADDQAKLEFALLVIKAESLASEIIKDSDRGYALDIRYRGQGTGPQQQSLTTLGQIPASLINTRYQKTAIINSDSQPFEAILTKQTDWLDFSWLRFFAIAVAGSILLRLVSTRILSIRIAPPG